MNIEYEERHVVFTVDKNKSFGDTDSRELVDW
jgi:hypothetical protein